MAINIDLNLNKVFDVLLHEEKNEDIEKKDGTEPSTELVNEGRNYRYPLSLTKNYPAHITFRAINVDGINFSEIVGKAYDAITDRYSRNSKNINTPDTTDTSESDNELTENEKETISKISSEVNSYNVSYENKEGAEPAEGSVMLPLQQSLTFQDGVQYNVANLGIAGSALGTVLNGGNPFEGLMKDDGKVKVAASALVAGIVAKNAAGAAGAAIGSFAGAPGAAVGLSALGDVGEGVGASIKNASRIASNPNQRTLFENVNMRNFSFTFKLIANSKKEATEIKNIIQFFREELYPEPVVTSAGIPVAYEFPNVFEIDIKNFKGDSPAPKIQRCYLENIQTVYNGTANSMHVDGSFVEVEISLTFREIVAMNKNKVKDGY